MLLKVEHGVNNFFRYLRQEVTTQDWILKSHKLLQVRKQNKGHDFTTKRLSATKHTTFEENTKQAEGTAPWNSQLKPSQGRGREEEPVPITHFTCSNYK